MSACTHVSASMPASSASGAASKIDASETEAAANPQEDADCKAQYVVQYCVEALLNDKKRKLALVVRDDVRRAAEDDAKAFECGCGCVLVPCAKRAALRDKYSQKAAQHKWPGLEKEFVRDVADSLWNAKRSNDWLSKELAASLHENGILRMKLGIVASVF